MIKLTAQLQTADLPKALDLLKTMKPNMDFAYIAEILSNVSFPAAGSLTLSLDADLELTIQTTP